MITSAPWVLCPEVIEKTSEEWSFREPKASDGNGIYRLISECPPLDTNSSYCNFLQSTHFSKTCILVENKGELAGFISSYQKPSEPNVLFIWQVAVAPRFRGHSLAYKMLNSLLRREWLKSIEAIETTITKSNQASWALFKKLDAKNSSTGKVTTFLDENVHFKGLHDTEYLYRIPLK
ncbi:diaminobutyrate acetyltransferase [Vibrio pomeroyi]|uniref:diaminobutyrate acetyltransferase n=1 Tax=Vibrio pomeroyi TaxID=198832 RepID=UPI0035A57657